MATKNQERTGLLTCKRDKRGCPCEQRTECAKVREIVKKTLSPSRVADEKVWMGKTAGKFKVTTGTITLPKEGTCLAEGWVCAA